MSSDWRSYRSNSSGAAASKDMKSGSQNGLNSTMSNFQSSSALSSRQSRLYGKRNDSGGRRSPVLAGYRGKARHSSETTDDVMHPAARTLNKRAASAERLFPLRSSHIPSKSTTNGDRSAYSRSTSLDPSARYGGSASDLHRANHSRDYSRVSGSTDRLDEDRIAENYNFNSSTHDLSSNHNASYQVARYQSNGMSPTGRSYYSYDEVEKLKADYQKQLQELKLDYQSRILAKDRDWDKKLQACKSELSSSQKMVTELRQRCNQMAEEYDKSMNELLNDREQAALGAQADAMASSVLDSDTVKALRLERDQYADDLQHVEKSFTDLHKRYDKLRETTQAQKRSEERLKTELKELRQQIQQSAINFDKMRDESQQKLTKAATEVDKARSSCKAEIVRLQMALKKAELKAQSLEQQLDQKTTENTELAQICDNLIALKSADATK